MGAPPQNNPHHHTPLWTHTLSSAASARYAAKAVRAEPDHAR